MTTANETLHTDLEIIEPRGPLGDNGPDLPALANAITETYAEAKKHAELAVIFALRTGALCNQAKEQVGHGKFGPWLRENCPAVTIRTAQRYMQLAGKLSPAEHLENSKYDTVSHLPQLTAPDFLEQLEDPEQLDAITEQVREVTNEKSLTQLYLDFGIIKKPVPMTTRNEPLAPKKEDNRSPDEKIAELREADIERLNELCNGLDTQIKHYAPYRDPAFARAAAVTIRQLATLIENLSKRERNEIDTRPEDLLE